MIFLALNWLTQKSWPIALAINFPSVAHADAANSAQSNKSFSLFENEINISKLKQSLPPEQNELNAKEFQKLSIGAFGFQFNETSFSSSGLYWKNSKPENILLTFNNSSAYSSTLPLKTETSGSWLKINFKTFQTKKEALRKIEHWRTEASLCENNDGQNCSPLYVQQTGSKFQIQWRDSAGMQSWTVELAGAPCKTGNLCSLSTPSWARYLRSHNVSLGRPVFLPQNTLTVAGAGAISLIDPQSQIAFAQIYLPELDNSPVIKSVVGSENGQVSFGWQGGRALFDFEKDTCLVLHQSTLLRCSKGLAPLFKKSPAGLEWASSLETVLELSKVGKEPTDELIALSENGLQYGKVSVFLRANGQLKSFTDNEFSPIKLFQVLRSGELQTFGLFGLEKSSQHFRSVSLLQEQALELAWAKGLNIELPASFPAWTLLFQKNAALITTSQGLFQVEASGKVSPSSIAFPYNDFKMLPERGDVFVRRGEIQDCKWYHVVQHATVENSFSETGLQAPCKINPKYFSSQSAVFAVGRAADKIKLYGGSK